MFVNAFAPLIFGRVLQSTAQYASHNPSSTPRTCYPTVDSFARVSSSRRVWQIASGTTCSISNDGLCVYSGDTIEYMYSASYGNSESCSIVALQDVVASSIMFSTEQCCDYVVINGQQYAGTVGPSSVAISSGSSIDWQSDSSEVDMGWAICVDATLPPMPPTLPPMPPMPPPMSPPPPMLPNPDTWLWGVSSGTCQTNEARTCITDGSGPDINCASRICWPIPRSAPDVSSPFARRAGAQMETMRAAPSSHCKPSR